MPNPKGRESVTANTSLVRLAQTKYPGLTKSRIVDLGILFFMVDHGPEADAERLRMIVERHKARIHDAVDAAFAAILSEVEGEA